MQAPLDCIDWGGAAVATASRTLPLGIKAIIGGAGCAAGVISDYVGSDFASQCTAWGVPGYIGAAWALMEEGPRRWGLVRFAACTAGGVSSSILGWLSDGGKE